MSKGQFFKGRLPVVTPNKLEELFGHHQPGSAPLRSAPAPTTSQIIKDRLPGLTSNMSTDAEKLLRPADYSLHERALDLQRRVAERLATGTLDDTAARAFQAELMEIEAQTEDLARRFTNSKTITVEKLLGHHQPGSAPLGSASAPTTSQIAEKVEQLEKGWIRRHPVATAAAIGVPLVGGAAAYFLANKRKKK